MLNDGYIILVEKSVLCRTVFRIKKGLQGQRLFDSQEYFRCFCFVFQIEYLHEQM